MTKMLDDIGPEISLENEILWEPKVNSIESETNMKKFMDHLNNKYQLGLSNYEDLYTFSVNYYHVVWAEIAEYSGIVFGSLPEFIVDMDRKISENPKWFYKGRINFAENLLIKNINNDATALIQACEDISQIHKLSYKNLYRKVCKIVYILKNEYNLQKGDRVVGYLPTGILAVAALLATTALGGIWSSVSPDFGVNGVLDRFNQIKPRIMFTVNGVLYNGKTYEHLSKLKQVVSKLTTLECVVIDNNISSIPLDLNLTLEDAQRLPKMISFDQFMNQSVNIVLKRAGIDPINSKSAFFSPQYQSFSTDYNELSKSQVYIETIENYNNHRDCKMPVWKSTSTKNYDKSLLLWTYGISSYWMQDNADWEYLFEHVLWDHILVIQERTVMTDQNWVVTSDDLLILREINPYKYNMYLKLNNTYTTKKDTEKMHSIDCSIMSSIFQHKFEHFDWSHPVYVLYSSGTTGLPKCIVHGAGGTLIQHAKEHILHGNMNEQYMSKCGGTGNSLIYSNFVAKYNANDLPISMDQDIMLYYTSTTWMMFNWLVSVLFTGNTIVLYDGSPMKPENDSMYKLISEAGVTIFGTSAKFLYTNFENNMETLYNKFNLSKLKLILSTGSPLAPASFDYVYRHISNPVNKNNNKRILLSSISGGSDIVSCFFSTNYMLPVYKGHLQSRNLGMAVYAYDTEYIPENDKNRKSGIIYNQSGELVCIKPFPCMPVCFFNDSPVSSQILDVTAPTNHNDDKNDKDASALFVGNVQYNNEHAYINAIVYPTNEKDSTMIDYNKLYDNVNFTNNFLVIDAAGKLTLEKTNYVNPRLLNADSSSEYCNTLGPKYEAAYFNKISNIWCHGDYVTLHLHCVSPGSSNDEDEDDEDDFVGTGNESIVISGRSDGILNPVGVRFGSAEIYNIMEEYFSQEITDSLVIGQVFGKNTCDERVILFIQLHDETWNTLHNHTMPNDTSLNNLVRRIQSLIRDKLSPRHVPSFIFPIKDIPYTTSGKKVEIAIKKLVKLAVHGETDVLNATNNFASSTNLLHLAALRNPESLQYYHALLPTLKDC